MRDERREKWVPFRYRLPWRRVSTVSPASHPSSSLFLHSSAFRPNRRDWCEAVTARLPRYRRQVSGSHPTVDVRLISGCLSRQGEFSGWKDTIPMGLLVYHSPWEPILPWEAATKDYRSWDWWRIIVVSVYYIQFPAQIIFTLKTTVSLSLVKHLTF